MSDASAVSPGQTLDQYEGKQQIGMVKVVSVDDDTAVVRALHGPLRGCEYRIKVEKLRARDE